MPEDADQHRRERLRTWIALLKVSRLVEAELRRRLRAQFDTTLPRFDVLAALARDDEGLKMSELSCRLMVSNGNVTGIVDRLVEEGWVARLAVAGDRRASRIALTDSGRARFAAMAKAHAGWVEELLGELSAAQLSRLNAALQHIRAPLEQPPAG